jgi:hypothetical protein
LRVVSTKHTQPAVRHEWRWHYLTDTHIDHPDHAAAALAARVKEIQDDPFALWSGGGDYADLILPGDKRWSPGQQKDEWLENLGRIPDLYIERVCDVFSPIKDKCVSFGIGNHEDSVARQYHRAVAGEVAAKLGIARAYVGYQGWSAMQFAMQRANRTQTVKLYQYHGWSGGRMKGRKALQAERDLGAWDADIIALGHDHQPYGDVWYTDGLVHSSRTDEWKVKRRARAVINGGAWLGASAEKYEAPLDPAEPWKARNTGWAEKKNYRPESAGGPIVRIRVDLGNSTNGGKNAGRPQSVDFVIEKRSSGWDSPAADYEQETE